MLIIRLCILLFALLLLFHIRKRVFADYPVFVFYIFYVFAHDTLFLFAPLFGLNYDIPWYYITCCLISDGDHILKFLLALSLYQHVANRLAGYRKLLYLVFFLTVGGILVFFVIRFNPSASFLYNMTIYLGAWSHLLMASVCTLILFLARMSHLRVGVTYRFIVLGLLLNGLLQTLNSFYLQFYYSLLVGVWRHIGAGGFAAAILLWWIAALGSLRQPHTRTLMKSELIQREAEQALVRHDTLTETVLRKLLSS